MRLAYSVSSRCHFELWSKLFSHFVSICGRIGHILMSVMCASLVESFSGPKVTLCEPHWDNMISKTDPVTYGYLLKKIENSTWRSRIEGNSPVTPALEVGKNTQLWQVMMDPSARLSLWLWDPWLGDFGPNWTLRSQKLIWQFPNMRGIRSHGFQC